MKTMRSCNNNDLEILERIERILEIAEANKVVKEQITNLMERVGDLEKKLRSYFTDESKQSIINNENSKSPYYVNEERDSLILEMRRAKKTFSDICDYINEQYPDEMLDEKAASAALKRYCDRLNVPYPYGKRGRKTDR